LVVPETIWPKRGRTCTTYMWSHIYDHLVELFIICRELLIFFGKMNCMLSQGHELLRLGARYRLRTPNGWETLRVVRKFSVVVLESPHTRFLSGPPDDPTSIHKSRSKSGWIEGLSSYLSLNRLLYVSWK
jgi:hypothetical protein